MAFCMVYITTPNQSTAQQISQLLLERRLVACTNMHPISSSYHWQGSIAHDDEWVLIAKTTEPHLTQLMPLVEQLHPYAVPCIAYYTAHANAAYEQWIAEQLR